MTQTVLITGGCGYIGSHVVRQLSENGYRCIVIDNLSNGSAAALINGETLVRSDYADEANLTKIFTQQNITAVMHFAASIVVPESVEKPIEYYNNNFVKCLTLFDTALKHGVKDFIFSSTAAVYGANDSISEHSEDSPLLPINPYGRSKLMVEWLLQDLAISHGLRYGILRYFNVAGADPLGRIGQSSKQASHLIKIASQVATGKRDKLTIFGTDYKTNDGTCIRDYVHVEDLADAHLLVLRNLLSSGQSEIFNCGYGRGYSVLDVINAFGKVTGKNLPHQMAGRRAGDAPILLANSQKIQQKLNWKPRYNDLNVIVRSALDWEKKL
jgi:UDP-glucose 4-epimerase